MERKNYLVEGLSKEETAYLKSIVVNARKRYIKDNYCYINNQCVSMEEVEEIEGESVLDIIINKWLQNIYGGLYGYKARW